MKVRGTSTVVLRRLFKGLARATLEDNHFTGQNDVKLEVEYAGGGVPRYRYMPHLPNMGRGHGFVR